MKKIRVLAIDDDRNILKSIELTLGMNGIDCTTASQPERGVAALDDSTDVVLLDVYLGSEHGRAVLKRLLARRPLVPVVMISGLASPEEAVDCIQQGAFDFIEKPLRTEKLLVAIRNAARWGSARRRNIGESLPVCRSEAMTRVTDLAVKAATTDSTVFITGESGTGKDVMARLIHRLSSRSDGPYVKINCGAIPEGLVESELFGHKKGAFTGAVSSYDGKIQAADGGTLFLDEAAELPLQAQVKLLRFLENREIQRVGESVPISVNVRLIAATNRNPEECVRSGILREDLYYRLQVLSLTIPPLRERTADIVPLAVHFLEELCTARGAPLPNLAPEAAATLEGLSFRGNVRELRNLVERILAYSTGGSIGPEDVRRALLPSPGDKDPENVFLKTMKYTEARHQLERLYLETQLRKFGGSITKTADALELLPNNLCRRLRQLGLSQGGTEV